MITLNNSKDFRRKYQHKSFWNVKQYEHWLYNMNETFETFMIESVTYIKGREVEVHITYSVSMEEKEKIGWC